MVFKTRQARPEELEEIKGMTDENISRDFYSLDQLKEILEKDDEYLFVAETEDGAIASYLYAFITTLDDALTRLHADSARSFFEGYRGSEKTAVYKTACTKNEYRKYGIITGFARDLEGFFRDRGAVLLLDVGAKLKNGELPIAKIMETNKFEQVTVLKTPWIKIRSFCPCCRKDYCECDGVLYKKDIK